MSILLLFIINQANAATLTVGLSQTYTTIQSAVTAAQDGDIIEVASGVYAESIQLGTKELTIIGVDGATNTFIESVPGLPSFTMSGQVNTTIQGFTLQPTSARGFQILSASPTLIDLVIEGASTTGQGGGIFVSGGAPVLGNIVFQNNTANSGGDIYATNGASVSIIDSGFFNSVAVYGGSIYIGSSSSLTVTSSVFSDISGTYGGVLYAQSGIIDFEDIDISNSFAIYDGAGFLLESSTMTLTDTQLNNSESVQGFGVGAYVSSGSTMTWTGGGIDGAFSQNTGYDGAGLTIIESSNVYIDDVNIQNCSGYRGGAVFVSASSFTVSSSIFDGNSAVISGGAVYGADGSHISLDSTEISANTASGGGGIDIRSFTILEDTNNIYQYNQATNEQGGAIRAEDNAQIQITGSIFSINSSYLDGGAVYIDDLLDTAQFLGAEFVSNASDSGDGGAIAIGDATDLTVQGSEFLGNTAADHGGALAFLPTFLQPEGISVLDSLFVSNSALRGGAASVDDAGYTWLLDNTFEDNVAIYLDGGALRLSSVGDLDIIRNIFSFNASNQEGGALWLNGNDTMEASILNNIWTENEADNGGAVSLFNSNEVVSIENNTFAGNMANLAGAHLYIDTTSIAFINNLAMFGQDGGGLYALDAGSAGLSDFYYNALYSNTGGDAGGFIPNLQIQTGNLALEPLVYSYTVDGVSINDNLHLQLISPLKDAGSPSLFDVDGTRSDIGAYGGLEAAAYDSDGDGFFDITDCDDTLATVYPNAPEVAYDGIDQDCLDGDLVDVDGDGFIADIIGGTDCDDAQNDIYPGAIDDWYDGIDANCDFLSDFDADGDGFDWNVYGGNDCDDSTASIGPAMLEVWYDGADQNCDGLSDYDADLDGHDAQGYGGDDCDESDPTIFTGAPEVPYDSIDQDCDGADLIDADFDGWVASEVGGPDCNDSEGTTYPGAVETWYDGIDSDCGGDDDYDADGDGQQSIDFGGTDCDDADPAIYLGSIEVWYDGIDSDCGGDDDYDADGDGQSALSHSGDDCDDTDPQIYLGAVEVWYDGIDSDCLGGDDYDADGDGYTFSDPPLPTSDCDDNNIDVHPDAEEIFDGEDNDCDGYLETDDRDSDGLMDWHEWTLGSDINNADSDGDSRLDGDEVSLLGDELVPFDTDDDGLLDIFDTDDDDDQIETIDELSVDIDGDGKADLDVDGDDILNHRDKDSDGDGLSDLFEGTSDSDLDGIPDYLDYAGDLKGGGCQVISFKPQRIAILIGLLGLVGVRRRKS